MRATEKVKKIKKNISLGIVHIKATFNNTIVTFTDVQGNSIASSTAGSVGFSGPKKSSPYAAQVCIEKAAEKARENGIKTISIRIKGPGGQREPAMRAVFNQNFIVTSITDVSPIAHNGCKPPKRRRV